VDNIRTRQDKPGNQLFDVKLVRKISAKIIVFNPGWQLRAVEMPKWVLEI
jgi:hypothetical protein